jgi:hypothetical protein
VEVNVPDDPRRIFSGIAGQGEFDAFDANKRKAELYRPVNGYTTAHLMRDPRFKVSAHNH